MHDNELFARSRLENAFAFAMAHDTFSKKRIASNAKNVCIYGLGKYFDEAFLRQNIGERFRVTHLCDGNAARREAIRQDVRYKQYSCIAPEEIGALENPAVIFMLGDPRQAMYAVRKQFPKEDWYRLITFNDLILDDTMGLDAECLRGGDRRDVLIAFDSLEDNLSREIFADVFCLRVAPHLAEKEYEDLCTLPQYFPRDIVKLTDHETVIDCGAYNGDTLQVFAQITEGRFARYDAFEIDGANFEELCGKARTIDEKRVLCHPYGVWDENKLLHYGRMSSADSYSIFNGNETSAAKVVKLDDFFAKQEKISFIKMDIEGAEMKALQGCSRIIREQRPKLAICVYHRIEDLWQIPNYIKSICSDYKLYIRHHAEFWVSETVCYAISG